MKYKLFDEYEIGEKFESYGRTITETDIVNFTCFAGLKVPLFIDEEFCRKHTPYGGRIAPGFMTASIAAGMMEDILGPYTLAAPVAGSIFIQIACSARRYYPIRNNRGRQERHLGRRTGHPQDTQPDFQPASGIDAGVFWNLPDEKR